MVLAGQGRTACRMGAWGWGGLAPVSVHDGAHEIAEGTEETVMLIIKRSAARKRSKRPANGTH